MSIVRFLSVAALCALGAMQAWTASAASCGNDGAGFSAWLEDFKGEAAAAGVSKRTINAALSGVTYDRGVIKLDRNQHAFKRSFAEFAARAMNPGRVAKGKQKMQQYASLLQRIEKRTGVPGAVVVAIWGMETDFGAGSGRMPVFRSLATLAYDCRRSAFFTEQLIDALKIVDRGDLSPAQMRGAWAGEMGQTQFMASSYYKFAIDGDGDGHANLISSPADVLASTANYLKSYGWRAGQPWHEGTANFQVLREWNKAEVYAKTVARFASVLAGGSMASD